MVSSRSVATTTVGLDRASHVQVAMLAAALAGTFVVGVLSAGGSVWAATLAAAVVLGAITAAGLVTCGRRLFAAAPRHLEGDLEALRHALPDTLVRVDREGRIRGVLSPHPSRLFARRDLAGTDVLDAVAEGQRGALGSAIAATLATGHPSALELDGPEGPVETRVVRAGEDEAVLVCRSVSPERLADRERVLLAKLVTELQDAVVLLDREGRVRVWTGAAERIYGWTAEEMVGRSALELVDPQPSDVALDRIADAFRTRSVCRFRSRDLRKDGSRIPTSIMLVPHDVGDGATVQVLAVCRDMSAEATAEAEKHLLAALTREMADAVMVLDADARIQLWTGGAEAIYGWSADEAVGRSVLEVTSASARSVDVATIRETLASGTPVRYRSETRRRDGTRVVCDAHAVPLRDAGGTPARALIVSRDVTRQTEMEEALARSRDQLASAVENSGLGAWALDVETGALEYDRLWPALLGYGPDEIPRRLGAWVKLADPAHVARTRAAVFAHFKGETESVDCEFRLRDKAGEWRWIHTRGRVCARDANGRALRLTGTHGDVTRRREAEECMRAALEANVRLVAELREALSNVKTLSGLLPVCAWCKKIRDDAGYWQRIETYLAEHSGATFTHGMCPECHAREFGLPDGGEGGGT
jgi:PAS domain S-box-containing protein